jgi:hypothetical protein
MKIPRTAAWASVAAMVVIAFIARWTYLKSFDWPLGIDGFYYAVQVRSLLQDHRLYYPASPMVFWLMVPAASLLGPIAGAKLTAALGTSLGVVPVYAIVSRATGQRAAGLVGAAIMATAAGGFYLTVEFVKQGVGLTLALGFVATFAAAIDTREAAARRRWTTAAIVLGSATLLSHLTAIGIALCFTLPVAWVALPGGDQADRRRRVALMGAGLVALAILVAALVPATRHRMGLGHLFDSPSLSFTGDFHTFHHEVPLGFLAALALAVAPGTWRPSGNVSATSRALLAGPAALAVLLAVPWLSVADGQGLTYRLRVMAFVPMAICAPAALMFFLDRFAPRLVRLVPVATSAMIIAVVPWRYPGPALPPNATQISGLTAIAGSTPSDAIIVVRERTLAFMIKWLADREARTQPPGKPSERPVYRLATPGVLPAEARDRLALLEPRFAEGLQRPVRLGSGSRRPMLLIPERTWEELLSVIPAADRARLEPWPGH